MYPPNWPRCPHCGDFALDGHITCGRVGCNESDAREECTEHDYEAHINELEAAHYRQLEGEEREREERYAGEE